MTTSPAIRRWGRTRRTPRRLDNADGTRTRTPVPARSTPMSRHQLDQLLADGEARPVPPTGASPCCRAAELLNRSWRFLRDTDTVSAISKRSRIPMHPLRRADTCKRRPPAIGELDRIGRSDLSSTCLSREVTAEGSARPPAPETRCRAFSRALAREAAPPWWRRCKRRMHGLQFELPVPAWELRGCR